MTPCKLVCRYQRLGGADLSFKKKVIFKDMFILLLFTTDGLTTAPCFWFHTLLSINCGALICHQIFVSQISGYHSDMNEVSSLVGCDILSTGKLS
jgi:hypothetical protein